LKEVEKYKNLLGKAGTDAKDQIESTRKTSDKLFAENARLMKQKQDLILAFKKQSQLVDVLKRQRVWNLIQSIA
jgi:hypothetical protein